MFYERAFAHHSPRHANAWLKLHTRGRCPNTQDAVDERAADLKAYISGGAEQVNEGTGTKDNPMAMPVGTVPLSEFRTHGYVTAAFPTLFPFGYGSYTDRRAQKLSWQQWSQHLINYHDGRFARHERFRYFLLNSHERELANRQAGLCVRNEKMNLTVGDVRQLSKEKHAEITRSVDKYGVSLRNTPAFFQERRKELECMVEQVGDPHVWATNSHADTHCPLLARFIKDWAEDDFKRADCSESERATAFAAADAQRAAHHAADKRYEDAQKAAKLDPTCASAAVAAKAEADAALAAATVASIAALKCKDGVSAHNDPFDAGIADDAHEQAARRVRNLKAYPHLAALFFHLKTEATARWAAGWQ